MQHTVFIQRPALQVALLSALLFAATGAAARPVRAANNAPTISGTPPTTIAEGASYNFTPTARDADGNSLSFSATNRPSWARIDTRTGKLTGTPSSSQAGTYSNISIKVSDGRGGSATLGPFAITVTNVNQVPSISGSPTSRVAEGSAYSFTPSGRDSDGDKLTYSVTGLPSWASFSTTTGAITGTPGYDKAGTYSNITVSVSDGSARASLSPFSITVSDTNRAPTITGTPASSVVENGSYSFTPSASDPDGDALSFSITGRPAWASFDSTNGKLTGAPDLDDAGSYSGITITVSDGRNRVSLPAFTITVTQTNQAPVISGAPVLRAIEGQAYSFTPSASDPDGDRLSYSIVNKPSWASFSASTGALTGTPPAGRTGSYPGVTITVSDGKLSASLAAFDIQVYSMAGSNQPRGIYSIDKVINRPFVDGVAVRPKWDELEPSEGRYDFSKIDKAVRDAAAVGQDVTIATLVTFAPDWLRAKSEQFEHKGDISIVPWDETMLAALEKLVQAMAAHTVDGVALRDHPAVKQVNAGIGGITSVRLVDLPSGYTPERFGEAVARAIGFWADAFPSGKHLYVGLFAIADDIRNPSTTEVIRDNLLATFDGNTRPRIHFFQELLTGQTPMTESNLGQVLLGVEGRAGVMFQACGPWVDQGSEFWSCNWIDPVDTPDLGFKLGLETYGTVYFEIYNGDLENDAYRLQFETWRTRIDQALQ